MSVGNGNAWQENIQDMATSLEALLAKVPSHNATQSANTAGDVVIKNAPGTLWSATVTTLGTAQLDIYDNASAGSGTKLLSIPANAPVGSIYNFNNGAIALNGITSHGVVNCPAVTLYYS